MRIVKAIFGHMSGRIGGIIVLIYILLAILGTLGVTRMIP